MDDVPTVLMKIYRDAAIYREESSNVNKIISKNYQQILDPFDRDTYFYLKVEKKTYRYLYSIVGPFLASALVFGVIKRHPETSYSKYLLCVYAFIPYYYYKLNIKTRYERNLEDYYYVKYSDEVVKNYLNTQEKI